MKRVWSFVTGNNFFTIVVIVAAGIAYLRYAPDSWKPWTAEQKPPIQPSEPREVVKIKRVLVPGPERVQVIEKIKYIEKMPDALTPATVADNSAQVIASAKIPPAPAGGTASAILRIGPDGVGTGSIEWEETPPPFFALQKEFGARAGIGTSQLILGEIYARPARIGPVTIELRGFGRNDKDGSEFGAVILGDMRF